jgi:hypothetical protein
LVNGPLRVTDSRTRTDLTPIVVIVRRGEGPIPRPSQIPQGDDVGRAAVSVDDCDGFPRMRFD